MAQLEMERFKFGTQNVTEGLLPHDITSCDAAVLQEIDREKVIRQCKVQHMECFIPKRDKHQAMIWNPQWIDMRSTGWTVFHRSGTAEDFPFATPARGMIWGRGRLVEDPKIKVALFGVWFLNSWEPMRPDHHTHLRNQIVEHKSIPVVMRKIREWQRNDYVVIGGGDANSIKWQGHLGHSLKQPWAHGLDRIWYDNRLNLILKHEGPITGVGPDMKHASRIVALEA